MNIEQLNNLLRSELGERPQYAWKWSEDLMRVMDAIDDLGRPIFEDVYQNGIWGRQQKKVLRPLCPDLRHQWVICALIKMSDQQGALYHTGDYAWLPCRDSHSRPTCLAVGLRPNDYITQDFIRQMRAVRSKRAPEQEVEIDALMKKRERDYEKRCEDAVHDALTAFYEVPGVKGGTSFPTPMKERQTNESTGNS